MKFLHTVQLYHPVIGGSEEVVKQLSERLVRRGHEVTVATRKHQSRTSKNLNGVHIEEFDIKGNAVSGMKGEISRFQRFIQEGTFDAMLNYAAQIWSTDLVFPLLKDLPYKKVLVPCGYPALSSQRFATYYAQLPTFLRQYDAIVYLSSNYRDKNFGDQHHLTNGLVIPNGASEDEFTNLPAGFRKKYGIRTKHLLLTVANHYTAKGHNFVIDAWKKLGRSDTSLVIIGEPHSSFPYLGSCWPKCYIQGKLHPNIHMLTGVPRQDVISAYAEADAFVFGSEIECSPLVIFESMAAGLPFVTTNCGSVQDLAAFGHIVDSPTAMATILASLLNNASQKLHEGQKAKQAWREHYTWERITDQYEQLYVRLAAK